jgi:dCMP deaminase
MRPSQIETWLRVAEVFAARSTCRRLQVGAVVTDESMLMAYGVGYNGNARKLSNDCDADAPGACGCIHAEANALLKAPGVIERKRLFTTHSPCEACAKLIINANVTHVYFRDVYRSRRGIELLCSVGVVVTWLPAHDFPTPSIDGTPWPLDPRL